MGPMTNLDRIRDEAGKPPLGDFSNTASQHQARRDTQGYAASERNSVVSAPRARNGGLWFVILLLTVTLLGMSGYAYMELERVNGMQRTMLERVNVLAAASDQIDTKLMTSGGQLQETQSSLKARVAQLEQKAAEQLKLVEQTAAQGKSIAADLKTQFVAGLDQQTKTFQSTTASLKGDLMADLKASLDKQFADSDALNLSQTKALDAVKQSLAALEKGVSKVSSDLKSETNGFSQSLELLKEELAIDPARLKTLQDQFTTYMQSVDQFRQQTNASLNELSTQIRDVYQSQESSSTQGYDAGPDGFGVQAAPR
jgi:chromosome segregation ATPase